MHAGVEWVVLSLCVCIKLVASENNYTTTQKSCEDLQEQLAEQQQQYDELQEELALTEQECSTVNEEKVTLSFPVVYAYTQTYCSSSWKKVYLH